MNFFEALPSVLSTFLLVSAGYYAVVILSFAFGFQRVLRGRKHRSGAFPTVSVIVAARNESLHIEACIRAIFENDYPAERFDLTIVDDLSTDTTPQIVRGLMNEFNTGTERLKMVQVHENGSRLRAHKKHAVQKTVSQVEGEIVLLTDADCLVPTTWVSAMVACFRDDTGFVAGPVLYETDGTLFSDVQALEFLGLVAVGAGAIGLGRPILANGANAAYRRRLFLDIGGYEGIDHLTSGDDELLMQKIAADGRGKVVFCPFRSAAVLTAPSPDAASFVQQRRRWASKGSRYPNARLVAAIAGIYAPFPLLMLLTPAAFFLPEVRAAVLTALILKVGAELCVLIPASVVFRRMKWLRYLPVAEVLHIPYIALVPLAGILGGYHWKGRKVTQ